jgi:hypothetical protein
MFDILFGMTFGVLKVNRFFIAALLPITSQQISSETLSGGEPYL